jgi:hypothetical protein
MVDKLPKIQEGYRYRKNYCPKIRCSCRGDHAIQPQYIYLCQVEEQSDIDHGGETRTKKDIRRLEQGTTSALESLRLESVQLM